MRLFVQTTTMIDGIEQRILIYTSKSFKTTDEFIKVAAKEGGQYQGHRWVLLSEEQVANVIEIKPETKFVVSQSKPAKVKAEKAA
jgi:hypothetical protein